MNPRFISFHYVLKNQAGELLDSSHEGEPMTYIEGEEQIVPGLEKQMKNVNKGDKKKVVVNAVDAYGERDDRLVMQVPLTDLPNSGKIEEGTEYRVQLDDESSHVFRVTGFNETHATLDGNHPLASVDLHFDVEVKEAREATDQEMSDAEESQACCDHDHEGEHDHHDGDGHQQ